MRNYTFKMKKGGNNIWFTKRTHNYKKINSRSNSSKGSNPLDLLLDLSFKGIKSIVKGRKKR